MMKKCDAGFCVLKRVYTCTWPAIPRWWAQVFVSSVSVMYALWHHGRKMIILCKNQRLEEMSCIWWFCATIQGVLMNKYYKLPYFFSYFDLSGSMPMVRCNLCICVCVCVCIMTISSRVSREKLVKCFLNRPVNQ